MISEKKKFKSSLLNFIMQNFLTMQNYFENNPCNPCCFITYFLFQSGLLHSHSIAWDGLMPSLFANLLALGRPDWNGLAQVSVEGTD